MVDEGKRYWWTARVTKVLKSPGTSSHDEYTVTPVVPDKSWKGGDVKVVGEKILNDKWKTDKSQKGLNSRWSNRTPNYQMAEMIERKKIL